VKEPVSDTWVKRFITRYTNQLTHQWTLGIDSNRHAVDSGDKYKLYFDLLQRKIAEYNEPPEQIYNMDEKGFMIGVIGRSKGSLANDCTPKCSIGSFSKMAIASGLPS
jgi:hypothetical protein